MASAYTGVSTAAQSPSPAPSLSADPIGNLPADGDSLNASSIIQALKVPLDWIAFLRLWASGVAASITSAIAAALSVANLTTQVAIQSGAFGSVAGQYLSVAGSKKEIGFTASASFTHQECVVELSGSAYLGSTVRNIQVTVTGGAGAWQAVHAYASLTSSSGTKTVITVGFDGLVEAVTSVSAYVLVTGGW